MSELVELARFYRAFEAELARTFLESHGLHAAVFDSGFNIVEGGGIAAAARLMVLDDEFDQATVLLKEYER